MNHRELITNSIHKYMDIAREAFPHVDLPDPNISFNMRGGRVFGQARYRSWSIRINDEVSAKYVDDAINDTAPHEVAHLVAYKVYGRCQGHGPNWKHIMRLFGVAPNRCADAKLDTLEFRQFKSKTEYVYGCGTPGCEHNLSAARHNKIQRGGARYICNRTRGYVDYTTFIRSLHKTAEQRRKEVFQRAGRPVSAKQPTYAAAAKTASHKSPTTGSKKDRAETLYQVHKGKSRSDIIDIFMSQLDMTAAGAATYYANCKKKFG